MSFSDHDNYDAFLLSESQAAIGAGEGFKGWSFCVFFRYTVFIRRSAHSQAKNLRSTRGG